MSEEVSYMEGFGSYCSSEALPNALPPNQNSPRICPYGLYAEQLSGAPFTAPRAENVHSWLYRIRPSVIHPPFTPFKHSAAEMEDMVVEPNQLRWDPIPLDSTPVGTDFVDGLRLVCGAGDPCLKEGICIYTYTTNASMCNKAMYNSDGDFLIVPQAGTLSIKTEMGLLVASPCEIVIIPRGIRFSVDITEHSRGYVAELFSGHLELPTLGVIGSNGLANPRHFLIPRARFEDLDREGFEFLLVNKYMGKWFKTSLGHSPFDVVAWHGNYYPYKYDLKKFNTINTVSFDHPDPSIFTVLTCPTNKPGTAALDFVIFPPRWMVAEHTFRPPYYHRNCMTEYMGMIYGSYDGKGGGFAPGGGSLHSCMTPHGPDTGAFKAGSGLGQEKDAPQTPVFFDGGLAFMFESCYLLKVAPKALKKSSLSGENLPQQQVDYYHCWQGLPKLFTGEPEVGPK